MDRERYRRALTRLAAITGIVLVLIGVAAQPAMADPGPPTVTSTTPTDAATGVAVSVHPAAIFNEVLNPATVVFTLKDSAAVVVPGAAAYDNATKTVTFTPTAVLGSYASYTASVQASDIDGNAMAAPVTWQFTTGLSPAYATLFASTAVPANVATADSNAVEVGMRFVASANGTIAGLRFYQGPGNTGVHLGNLWTASGTLLATVTFPTSSVVGWRAGLFATPVNVTAGSVYVVSYFAPDGHYAADANYFASPVTNGALTAPSAMNGVFRYGASSGFPVISFSANNYWVDPLFVSNGTTPAEYRIFDASDVPANVNWNDPNAIEVGVKFTVDVAGSVTGVRFYKGLQNTGNHTGSLWSVGGELLATATFSGETESGWQKVTFSSPVPVTAGTTYIASYHTTVGFYSVNGNGFLDFGVDSGPLHVLAAGGAYHYGPSAFPDTASSHNYWVDVTFKANKPVPNIVPSQTSANNGTLANTGNHTQYFALAGLLTAAFGAALVTVIVRRRRGTFKFVS